MVDISPVEIAAESNGDVGVAGVVGQMTVIMLSSTIRSNAFRDVYQRLTARGMRPAAALGHVAGKLSAVLYRMLKNMKPYDERKHREQLGLLRAVGQVTSASVEVSLELIDLADSDTDLVEDATPNDDHPIVL